MPGVRIQHESKRSVTFTVTDGSRVYREPLICEARVVVRGELRPCARIHTHKTYHLNLDETGAVIVSAEIAARVTSLPGSPFRVANEVARPPDQVVRIPRPLIVLGRPKPLGALHVKEI